VTPDGVDPAIDGWFERRKPLSPAEQRMVELAASRGSEELMKKQFGVQRWVRDVPTGSPLAPRRPPTVNIEGLVGG